MRFYIEVYDTIQNQNKNNRQRLFTLFISSPIWEWLIFTTLALPQTSTWKTIQLSIYSLVKHDLLYCCNDTFLLLVKVGKLDMEIDNDVFSVHERRTWVNTKQKYFLKQSYHGGPLYPQILTAICPDIPPYSWIKANIRCKQECVCRKNVWYMFVSHTELNILLNFRFVNTRQFCPTLAKRSKWHTI